MFNADIADLVAEVTDDKRLSKEERKRKQVEHAAAKSVRAKILKLADKTSNLRSLTKSPPTDWSQQRKREYLDWAIEVAKGLRSSNAWLEARFDEAAEQLARAEKLKDAGENVRCRRWASIWTTSVGVLISASLALFTLLPGHRGEVG